MRASAPLLILLVGSAGCLDGAPPPAADLDVGYYECQIQPIFDRSCAFNSCHGDPGRSLFVYSTSKRRIVAEQLIGEPLTDKELCWNYYRASVLTTADPRHSQLITKPATLDGYESQYHEGNYLYSAGDPEAECLSRWMLGATQAAGTSTPSDPCALPWRVAADGTRARCTPRPVDCEAAIEGPDLPEVAR